LHYFVLIDFELHSFIIFYSDVHAKLVWYSFLLLSGFNYDLIIYASLSFAKSKPWSTLIDGATIGSRIEYLIPTGDILVLQYNLMTFQIWLTFYWATLYFPGNGYDWISLHPLHRKQKFESQIWEKLTLFFQTLSPLVHYM